MGRPRKTKSLADQIRDLDEEIPALEVAIRLQEQRQRDAEAAIAAPRLALVGAVLERGAERQGEAIEQTHVILAQLAGPLAVLIAEDKIREALIGDRFPIPRGAVPPFGGLRAAKTLLEGLPEKMRPSDLAERLLFEKAHALSTETIAEIRGDESCYDF